MFAHRYICRGNCQGLLADLSLATVQKTDANRTAWNILAQDHYIPFTILKTQRGRWMGLIWVLTFATLFLLTGMVHAEEKIKIGLVEDVILLRWGVKLPARIDTGAASSSIDARELKVQDNMAEFKLPDKYGGLQLRLPVIDWRTIRSAEGYEKRPVVEMEVCLGPKRLRIKVNLNDRSIVKYPLIIGRNALKKHFVIDCMKSNCFPPSCPEVTTK
jgi:hypothetical protein